MRMHKTIRGRHMRIDGKSKRVQRDGDFPSHILGEGLGVRLS